MTLRRTGLKGRVAIIPVTAHAWRRVSSSNSRSESFGPQRKSPRKNVLVTYDPIWEQYFERRLEIQMVQKPKGYRKLIDLWYEQNGKCPVCNQKITKLTGWNAHHIIWRSHGGSDGISNLVLLHPVCHWQVHSLGLTVAKPRP